MYRQVRSKKCAPRFIAALILSVAGWPGYCFAADAPVTVTTRVRAADVLGPYAAPALRPSVLASYGSVQSLSGGWSCDWVEYCTVTKADGVVTDVSCGDWQQENCQYDPGDIYNPGDGGHNYWGGSGGGGDSRPLCYTPNATWGGGSLEIKLGKNDYLLSLTEGTPEFRQVILLLAADAAQERYANSLPRLPEIRLNIKFEMPTGVPFVNMLAPYPFGESIQWDGKSSVGEAIRIKAGKPTPGGDPDACRSE